MIGTTGDPATPYAWAVKLAADLASGVLLTRIGEGHTAYGGKSACIDAAVDAYLISLIVPRHRYRLLVSAAFASGGGVTSPRLGPRQDAARPGTCTTEARCRCATRRPPGLDPGWKLSSRRCCALAE